MVFLYKSTSNRINAPLHATRTSSVAISVPISVATVIIIYSMEHATKYVIKFNSAPMSVNLIVESVLPVESNVRCLVRIKNVLIFVERNAKYVTRLALINAYTQIVQRNALNCVIGLHAIIAVLSN